MVPPVSSYVLACAILASAGAVAAPFAYVPNEGSGTLSVIDVASDKVVGQMQAGSKPRGIAVDAKRIYVTDQPANALLVLDATNRRIESRIELGDSPEGASISRDGALVAVASEVANAV